MRSIFNILRSAAGNAGFCGINAGNRRSTVRQLVPIFTLMFGGGTVIYSFVKYQSEFPVKVACTDKIDNPKKTVRRKKPRERWFMRFASVEYNGQVYMTPQDFLESVVKQNPRPRLKRKVFTARELQRMISLTPTIKKNSAQLFQNIGDYGIISYTEYLFLLSILTKPQSGFWIAFNMFDRDGDKHVDKNEFLIMERIFSFVWRNKRGNFQKIFDSEGQLNEEYVVNDGQSLQRHHYVDTTLAVHLFGTNGKNKLHYEDFNRFMQNLQKEVTMFEFRMFSKGMPTISEVDFTELILRYTYLHTDTYVHRLLTRIDHFEGITFEEFYVFSQFLNNLDDFRRAMHMYMLVGHCICEVEFQRAVKICTGSNLSEHLVHIIFALFDENGDGKLKYPEFIGIMKDRLHRGFKLYTHYRIWHVFMECLSQELSK